MAIWQFHLQIISRQEVEDKYQPTPEIIGEDEIESLKGWGDVASKDKVIEVVSSRLESKKSWSKDILQWGSEDSHCVELLIENDSLLEVSIRIDLRDYNNELLDLIMAISTAVDGLVVIENRVYQPNPRSILKELEKSNASKFLTNPIKYLDDLDDK